MDTTVARVDVRLSGGDEYEVTIRQGAATSRHLVRVSERSRQNYGGDAAADHLLAESVRWVLEREPTARLLPRFDLPVLADSHPEYSREIWARLH